MFQLRLRRKPLMNLTPQVCFSAFLFNFFFNLQTAFCSILLLGKLIWKSKEITIPSLVWKKFFLLLLVVRCIWLMVQVYIADLALVLLNLNTTTSCPVWAHSTSVYSIGYKYFIKGLGV